MHLFQENEDTDNDNFYMNDYMEENIFDQLGDSQDFEPPFRKDNFQQVSQDSRRLKENQNNPNDFNYGFGSYLRQQPAGIMTALEKDLRIIPEQDESVINSSPKTCISNSHWSSYQIDPKPNSVLVTKFEQFKPVTQKASERKFGDRLNQSGLQGSFPQFLNQEKKLNVPKAPLPLPNQNQDDSRQREQAEPNQSHTFERQEGRLDKKEINLSPEKPKTNHLPNFNKPIKLNTPKKMPTIEPEPPVAREKTDKLYNPDFNLLKNVLPLPSFNLPTRNLTSSNLPKSNQNSSTPTPKANPIQIINPAPPLVKKISFELPKIVLPPKIEIPKINPALPTINPVTLAREQNISIKQMVSEDLNPPDATSRELGFVAKKVMTPENSVTRPLIKPPEINFKSFNLAKPSSKLNLPTSISSNLLNNQQKSTGFQLPQRSLSLSTVQKPPSKGRASDRQRIVELHKKMLQMKDREKRLKLSLFCMNSKSVFLKERIDKLTNSISLALG